MISRLTSDRPCAARYAHAYDPAVFAALAESAQPRIAPLSKIVSTEVASGASIGPAGRVWDAVSDLPRS